MQLRRFLLAAGFAACASLAPSLVAQPAAPAAAKTPADADLDAVWALYRDNPADAELRKTDPKAWFRAYDARMRRFVDAARAYAAKYPTTPERFNPLIQSSYTRPYFITGFKPEFDATPRETNVIADEPALIAFLESQAKYLAEVIEAPEADLRQRGGATVAYFVDQGILARLRGTKFDVETARPLVERAMEKVSNETVLPVVDTYLDLLRRDKPEAAQAFEAQVRAHPKIAPLFAVAEAKREAAAAEKAKKLTALAAMKFTAADGRAVDLAQLKGKVVLVDFWATWCGPCIAELPNVKKVYAEYHAQGFEIVGITLERSGVNANDTPEQAERKHAAAKKKLLDFVAKNEMPWPQHYDGKHFQNEYAVQFGINAIPAMFLLDQQGRVVPGEARGEKLEAEVKRLLGL